MDSHHFVWGQNKNLGDIFTKDTHVLWRNWEDISLQYTLTYNMFLYDNFCPVLKNKIWNNADLLR